MLHFLAAALRAFGLLSFMLSHAEHERKLLAASWASILIARHFISPLSLSHSRNPLRVCNPVYITTEIENPVKRQPTLYFPDLS